MDLQALRTVLSRWLQDTAGVQWDATKLNLCFNLAVREVEKHILSCDPETFKCTYYASTVVPSTGKDNLYSYPVGTFAVHEIALSTDGVNYGDPLPRRGLNTVRRYKSEGATEACFVPWDAKHFMIYPSASTVVASGIRIIVAPTLGMTEDTDENPLPLSFETLLIMEAKRLALPDVGQPTDDVTKEIERMKGETARFFLTATEPMFFEPGLTRY